MNILIQNDDCWICGTKKDLTLHHTIPKRYFPKKNVLIPLCERCHKNINSANASDLIAFTTKIFFMIKELKENVRDYFRRDTKK